jgi:hypothetical protein
LSLRVVFSTQIFDEPIEVPRHQNLLQSRVERMTRRPWKIVPRDPHGCRLSLPSSKCHAPPLIGSLKTPD